MCLYGFILYVYLFCMYICTDVIHAVLSFPTDSVGGPDGLRPQHLKDLVTYTLIEGSDRLLDSLTEFVNLVICGKVPVNARPFFLSAILTGLGKKGGGVRPIAVGCILRRLAAKCLCTSVFDEMGSLLFPHQLRFAMGAKAAVHTARPYLSNLKDGHLMIKLDSGMPSIAFDGTSCSTQFCPRHLTCSPSPTAPIDTLPSSFLENFLFHPLKVFNRVTP